MNRKIKIITLGCKVNQYESEAIRQLFLDNGDIFVEDNEEIVDIIVINTCSVTHVSAKKSRQIIRRMRRKNPEALLAVVGCYSQTSTEEVEKLDSVNLVLGTKNRNKIVQLLENLSIDDYLVVVDQDKKTEFEELNVKTMSDNTRAFIKIQDGCNMFCTYCIIPYARGQIRSRPLADIIKEVQTLVSFGYKEIVLTGIHLASYGRDLKDKIDLATVIEELSDIIGLKRIRLGSIEPRVVTADFLNRIQKVEQFCPQFHLSLQSGSDATLQRMNRRYTTAEYQAAAEALRKVYPLAALTTDVIVGFPAETEEEFAETYNFVKNLSFSELHVFPFSKREGTVAYDMEHQVDNSVKKQRIDKLLALAEDMSSDYMMKFIGQELDVLLENTKVNKYYGLTKEHVGVEILAASVKPEQELKSGRMVRCKIEASDGEKLIGSVL